MSGARLHPGDGALPRPAARASGALGGAILLGDLPTVAPWRTVTCLFFLRNTYEKDMLFFFLGGGEKR